MKNPTQSLKSINRLFTLYTKVTDESSKPKTNDHEKEMQILQNDFKKELSEIDAELGDYFRVNEFNNPKYEEKLSKLVDTEKNALDSRNFKIR